MTSDVDAARRRHPGWPRERASPGHAQKVHYPQNSQAGLRASGGLGSVADRVCPDGIHLLV